MAHRIVLVTVSIFVVPLKFHFSRRAPSQKELKLNKSTLWTLWYKHAVQKEDEVGRTRLELASSMRLKIKAD